MLGRRFLRIKTDLTTIENGRYFSFFRPVTDFILKEQDIGKTPSSRT